MIQFIVRLIIVSSMFLLVGCGGGSAAKDKTAPTLHVSMNILKTAYLDPYGLTAPLIFAINTLPVRGDMNLSIGTGRYAYLSTLDGNDSFSYTVTDANGLSVNVTVPIDIGKVPVTLNNIEQDHFSSNLPIVIVDTGDQEIPDEPKIKGTMTIIEQNSTGRSSLSQLPDYSGYMEIEVRGSSSQTYPKKQYSVDTETWDEEDDDISLLSMPKEHKWILHAPYADKSLMRNYLAYHKTREIDENQYYAVRSRYVELLTRVGGVYRYDGVYILMEKIKRDKGRLDIAKLSSDENDPPDVTGGYIIKQDKDPDPDEDSFMSYNATEFIYVYPKSSKITPDQSYYIEWYVQEFGIAIASSEFNDSTSSNYYNEWIDEESFIVHFLSRELFLDVDTWLYSEYLHKDKEEKLALSTVWDFNFGMGNDNYLYEGLYQGWAFNLLKSKTGQDPELRYWVEKLMSDPAFHQKVKAKWITLRNGIWSDANMTSFIDQTQTLLTESAARNFERWPGVLGQYVWPNREACMDGGVPVYCRTFDAAVNEDLKIWLLHRMQWIDDHL